MNRPSLLTLATASILLSIQSPIAAEPIAPPALSEAHEMSRFAVIDPAYDALAAKPAPDLRPGPAAWLYGEAELESWRLQVLLQQTKASKLKFWYPGSFHTPSPRATFQISLGTGKALPPMLTLRAIGDVVITVGTREIYRAPASENPHRITLPKDLLTGEQTLRVMLSTKDEPPALLIEDGPCATNQAPWRWSSNEQEFGEPKTFPLTASGVPPHRLEPPETLLEPAGRDGDVLDMGREVFGRISFKCPGQPTLVVGESRAEALNDDPRHFEQPTMLKSLGNGAWISEQPFAFRYFRIVGSETSEAKCHALFSPAQYRGAFACSDERLTRIWMNSAYTLRLCRHDFLIDGVKRDRLPWVGDLAMSLMANAYVFGDGEIVRRSLVALGREGIDKEHLNGIVDYSMWWIIAQEYYQKYYADTDHLRREWPRIKDTLERLAARCDAEGIYLTAPKDWIFIDWVSADKQTALQILWWWAQSSGTTLARRLGETESAAHWKTRADSLGKVLQLRAWDAKAGSWRDRPDNHSGPSRHANIFAVASGLAKPTQSAAIRAALLNDTIKPVGTPYLAGFENMALASLGETNTMLDRVNACWGGMLDRGATTFWEAWDPAQQGDDAYAFYKRPFAKSLCHAWSAGPAAFLPSEIFGLRPLADGWARFSIDPRLGTLKWACATVPTPHGNIVVSVKAQRVTLHVPAGTTAVRHGKTFTGPGDFTLDL
jgi:alpha-L-rhamnosidase